MSTISPNIVVGATGAVPTDPSVIFANLVSYLTATNPGYTILPGALIEDILSTDVAAIALCDQAAVDLINSLDPVSSNLFITQQLGQIYGVPQGLSTNTSVNLVFTGTPGYVIPQGFTVTDGTYQYVLRSAGVISGGGSSAPLFAVATVTGTWAVPANSVTSFVTSVPLGVTLSVTNPLAGTPSSTSQTNAEYRSNVLQAGLASVQGTQLAVKARLSNPAYCPGVQPRLIAIQQQVGGWKIIVGGGDSYQIGFAIFSAMNDISILVGSATPIRNVNVSISDYPDVYNVLFVQPPLQTVAIQLTWNSDSPYAVSPSSIAQLGAPVLAAYINSIAVGAPINLFELQSAFQEAVVSLLPTAFLSRMVFTVSINGIATAPTAGTGLIVGDSESYFQCFANNVIITQG